MDEKITFEWEQSLKWAMRMYEDADRAEAAIRVACLRYQSQSEEIKQDLFSICADLVRKSLCNEHTLDEKVRIDGCEIGQGRQLFGLVNKSDNDLLYVFGCRFNKVQRATKNLKFVSRATARCFARLVGICTKKEWEILYHKGDLPNLIPPNPAKIYKRSWRGWSDFLREHHKWRRFEEAREYCVNELVPQGIDTLEKYLEFGRAGLLRKDIPLSPDTVYKGEWRNWKHWFGNDDAYNLKRDIYKYKDAQEYVMNHMVPLGIDSLYKYMKYVSPPECLPSDLAQYYKGRGWTKSGDFFGTTKERVGSIKECESYYVVKNWCRNNLNPLGIIGKKQFVAYLQGKYEGAPNWPAKF